MKKAVIYGRSNPPCQYCEASKSFLKKEKIEYEFKEIDDFIIEHIQTKENTKVRTLPQIYLDNKYVGGYHDLMKYGKQQQLGSLEI